MAAEILIINEYYPQGMAAKIPIINEVSPRNGRWNLNYKWFLKDVLYIILGHDLLGLTVAVWHRFLEQLDLLLLNQGIKR